jgi:hypothetical protein
MCIPSESLFARPEPNSGDTHVPWDERQLAPNRMLGRFIEPSKEHPSDPMTLRSYAALFLLFAFAPQSALAQRNRCGTPEPTGGVVFSPSDCGYNSNSPQPEYEPSCYYDIQVVFHVIQRTNGVGFLDALTIQDQIDVLNEDFQAIPGSPGAPGTDARVRFQLATVDPQGQPTTGITYHMNNNWYVDSGDYWTGVAWDTNRYLNIYTNAVPCCYGYVSGFPSQGIAGQADDRVVLWWEAVGKNGTSGWPLNMGRTATHEVGHYLGLYHTFCGGCGSAQDCYGTGDLICDTNGEANSTSGCPSSKSSCGSPDPIHNYMDYTDDPCIWEFTPEQVNRMRCTLFNWRPLLADSNPVGVGETYCVSVANSSGSAAIITADGFPSLSSNSMTLRAAGAAQNTVGLYYYGPTQTQAPFGDGFRCVGGLINRLPPPLVSDGSGASQRQLDFTQSPFDSGPGMVLPGSTWNFQFWFRDPAGPGGTGFNLSDAVSIAFCP